MTPPCPSSVAPNSSLLPANHGGCSVGSHRTPGDQVMITAARSSTVASRGRKSTESCLPGPPWQQDAPLPSKRQVCQPPNSVAGTRRFALRHEGASYRVHHLRPLTVAVDRCCPSSPRRRGTPSIAPRRRHRRPAAVPSGRPPPEREPDHRSHRCLTADPAVDRRLK